MKKVTIVLFCLLAGICFSAIAQNDQPVIGTGSILHYQVTDETGDTHALTLTVDSVNDTDICLKWDIPDLGDGNFIMPLTALRTGTHGYWDQPYPGVDTRLDSNQTIACFSQQFYQQIINTGKAEYGGTEYIKNKKDDDADTEFRVNGKQVDALYLVSKDGYTKLWILDNPQVPLILKMTGNPSGIDVALKEMN